jgi:cold shock CspA family protein
MGTREKGTVKWFNSQKGFGFITPDKGGDDLFVHQSAIQALDNGFRTLSENDKVEYETVDEGGKFKATNVCGEGGAPIKPSAGGGRRGTGAPNAPREWPEDVAPSDGKQIGEVKWFSSEKGYGFVAPLQTPDGPASEDLFVHQSAINAPGFRSLMEGEWVEFKIVEERGKRKAVDVTGPKGDFVQGAPRNSGRGRAGGPGGGGGGGGGGGYY